MNKAIKLAIEKGGYVADELLAEKLKVGGNIFKVEIYPVILDPLFWQALGKALGWGGDGSLRSSDLEDYWIPISGPKYFAHQHLDLLLTSGDTEKFWKELLAQNNHDQT